MQSKYAGHFLGGDARIVNQPSHQRDLVVQAMTSPLIRPVRRQGAC